MTMILTPSADRLRHPVPYGRLLLVNLAAAAAAMVATEAWIGVVRATGVDLEVGDPFGAASSAVPITFGACAISIALSMLVAAPLSLVLNRKAQRPARTYAVVTCTIAVLSLGLPLAAAGTTVGTKATLMVAHLIAAAIIIPLVTRCLAARR